MIGYHGVITTSVGGTQYIYALGNATTSTVYKATIDTSGNIGTFSTTSQGQLGQAAYALWTTNLTISGTQYVYVTGGKNASEYSSVYKATIDSSGNIGAFATTSQAQLPAILAFHSGAATSIGGTNYIYILGGQSSGTNVSTLYKATVDSSGNIGAFSTTSQGQLPVAMTNQNSNKHKGKRLFLHFNL